MCMLYYNNMIIIISNNYILGGWELNGQEKQRTDIFGGIWRGATSSSGGTQPKYKWRYLSEGYFLQWRDTA